MASVSAIRLGPADYRLMPWKNGQGSTVELAIHPLGATLQSFDWRLSMADVAQDGDFSPFPGYDRSLMVASGRGMELNFASASAPQRLNGRGALAEFSGDWPTRCTLLDGPVRDFNVVSARGRVQHQCERIAVAPVEFVWEPGVDTLFCCCLGGTLVLKMPGSGEWQLDPEESLWLPVTSDKDSFASLMVMPHTRETLGVVVRLRAS